jgi:excisionase family DNA binding protein
MNAVVNTLYAEYLDHTGGDTAAAASLTLAAVLLQSQEGASPSGTPSDRPLTIRQAASFLGVSVGSVYDLCKSGQLRYFRIGRALRIDRKALAGFQKTAAVAVKQPLRHLRLGRG